ncbi:hypothetical protein ARMSODRAFT_1016798 [Armillaria solidipes]|uniref:Reverse transcriptase domain-containing protein n=1 Tax=Armillaria solidipes TaxID=1076256 RepID=A0A2H3BS77_9AGAR|nr:hypothetical protein ARMSODRAFT_1016798 [Armillaria solidipes]
MEELQARLDATLQDNSLLEEDRLLTAALLQQKIQVLQREINKKCHTSNMVRAKLELETISKYWIKIGNKKQSWDTVHELCKPGSEPLVYLKRSDKMASAARDSYDDLQRKETFPDASADERDQATTAVLDAIRRRVPEAKKEALATLLQYDEILAALKMATKGKATGIDGLPYELWLLLYNRLANSDDEIE